MTTSVELSKKRKRDISPLKKKEDNGGKRTRTKWCTGLSSRTRERRTNAQKEYINVSIRKG